MSLPLRNGFGQHSFSFSMLWINCQNFLEAFYSLIVFIQLCCRLTPEIKSFYIIWVHLLAQNLISNAFNTPPFFHFKLTDDQVGEGLQFYLLELLVVTDELC